MKMLRRNKKRSQGDGDVGFLIGTYLWVDGLAFEFWDGEWRAATFCVISYVIVGVRLTIVFISLLFFSRFGSVRFIGFSFKIKTEPNRQDFTVLKIGLISFLSRFGFLGCSVFLNTPILRAWCIITQIWMVWVVNTSIVLKKKLVAALNDSRPVLLLKNFIN